MNILIPNHLARAPRPGYPANHVEAAVVRRTADEWLRTGIRSVICLLDERQLTAYTALPGGLLAHYREAGLAVAHVPVADHKLPPLDEAETAAVLSAFANLPKPVLVHCSAGVDRTGAAVRALVSPDAYGIRPVDNVAPEAHPRNRPRPRPPANALFSVEPYLENGNWYVDDPSVGLVKEPFVLGVPEMIDHFTVNLPGPPDRFRLLFSARPFPGASHVLHLVKEEFDGGWYRHDELPFAGWLCPALLHYFRQPPPEIHLRAEPVPARTPPSEAP